MAEKETASLWDNGTKRIGGEYDDGWRESGAHPSSHEAIRSKGKSREIRIDLGHEEISEIALP
jgi:hypothetical protein